jgi:selenocysteine-specific elongation factor
MDADRLPEERLRGMTIDVGYAHMAFPDGSELDFVDVPGHERLIGNMLVGAGEIDGVMLVVAANDGPRAQTLEHLALLDALDVKSGIVVITKTDIAGGTRTQEVIRAVEQLIRGTSLDGSRVLATSSVDGTGIDTLTAALVELRDEIQRTGPKDFNGSRLAIDRVFSVKGRGTVVTGTLRGGPIMRGSTLRVIPGADPEVRVREVQVHGKSVKAAGPGRTALNIAGAKSARLCRGMVLTDDPAVVSTDRVMIQTTAMGTNRGSFRVHAGTSAVDGVVRQAGGNTWLLPDGSSVLMLTLAAPIPFAVGDRLLLRRAGAEEVIGGTVLDVSPLRGVSARRRSPSRIERLARSVRERDRAQTHASLLDLNGFAAQGTSVELSPDIDTSVARSLLSLLGENRDRPTTLSALRVVAARAIRREATIGKTEAATAGATLIDGLVAAGHLIREKDRVRLPGEVVAPPIDSSLAGAMDRLERLLDTNAPPPLGDAAIAAGCSQAGVRELERSGRIVVLAPNLAYAASTYDVLAARALEMAGQGPLTPAAFRDATGTSRKYVTAILEDQNRRQALLRTPSGHVLGPRAGAANYRVP